MSESNAERQPSQDADAGATHQAGAFDIRTIIAALIGIYGLVLVVMGVTGAGETERAEGGEVSVNLWAGIGMLVFAAAFVAWARLRPVVVPADPDEGENADGTGGSPGSH